ncbi:MAG: PAS domain S-box protein [Planctomycetes bacterium]|nr:PAS domain S-box protein [Planctomycetota bacterium]
MRRLRLTTKLILYVLACAAVEAALTAWLYRRVTDETERICALAAGGLATLLLLMVGVFIARQFGRPLHQLATAAERIGRGERDVEIGVRCHDEIGELAAALDEMQFRLRQVYDELEHRVALRTAELKEATDFLHSVLDSSTEYAIIATDARWRILTYNEGARRLFGYPADEVVGQPLERLVAPEDVEATVGLATQRDLRIHGRHEGEGVRLRRGGQRFPVRTVTTVRSGPDGQPIGYTVICRDITIGKALEARVQQYTDNLEQMVAEKTGQLREVNVQLVRANRLKSQFLANMSHELRTPLNAIMGFAEALRDGVAGAVTAEQREFAEDIHRAGAQLLQLITDILDFSKIEAGAAEIHLEPCDLGGIADEILRVAKGLARRRGVALAADVAPRPLELTADPMKLKQILYNLVSNAVKFTGPGGTVTVRGRLEKELVRIEVTDTGTGIAPEDLVTVFEEFRQVDSSLTRSHEGTGLGLALTRRLVELHGGEITVESEVGRGSTFAVVLLRDLVPGKGEGGMGPGGGPAGELREVTHGPDVA